MRAAVEAEQPLQVVGVINAYCTMLALENSFNRVGLDHVLLIRIASTAVVTRLLGGTREQIINALSNAFLDGDALRAKMEVTGISEAMF